MSNNSSFTGKLSSRVLLYGVFSCVLMFLTPGPVQADEFSIESVDVTLKGDVYVLNARVHYAFSRQLEQALRKGVTLGLTLDVEINRHRDYWLEEEVAILEQKYLIRFQSLTEHYIVKHINSGVENSFPSLLVALNVLGVVIDLPIIDAALIESDEAYSVNVRVRHDVENLPVPLRVRAYIYSGWKLESEWRTVSLKGPLPKLMELPSPPTVQPNPAVEDAE